MSTKKDVSTIRRLCGLWYNDFIQQDTMYSAGNKAGQDLW